MADLMTKDEFQHKSSKFMARRKNPMIKDIDRLLSLYHGSVNNHRRRLKILALLYVWTSKYLSNGGTRAGVAELKAQVHSLLNQSENTVDVTNKGGTFKVNGQPSYPAQNGCSLSAANRLEAFLPGKGKVGGLDLQFTMKRVNAPAVELQFKETLIAQGVNSNVDSQALVAAETASISEYLDEYLALTGSASFAGLEEFEYCDKTQREKYRVFINSDDGCLYKDSGFVKCFTTNLTENANTNEAAYALDLENKLYCKPVSTFVMGQFNHSSFMSGKPVLCAGVLRADNLGRITYLDNASGHYKPTGGDLGYMLSYLDDKSCNLTNVSVRLLQTNQTLNGTTAKNSLSNLARSLLQG
jgi:hypothetical protein